MAKIVYKDGSFKNCGYFYYNPDGSLSVRGFADLMNQNVRFSELDGAIILAHDDEDIPVEECIPFTKETLANPNVIKYLSERNAINTLFVKIFGIYSQCIDIQIHEPKSEGSDSKSDITVSK